MNCHMGFIHKLAKKEKTMNNRALTIFNQLRPVTVGFDNFFDHFERMFEADITAPVVNYPPYNIVRTGRNQFNIELALAGYNKKDIEVTVEEGQLTVKSKRLENTESKDANGEILHKGIASRYFERSFAIADDIEIKGAELKDGLLTISLEKIVPESKKLRTIEIL